MTTRRIALIETHGIKTKSELIVVQLSYLHAFDRIDQANHLIHQQTSSLILPYQTYILQAEWIQLKLSTGIGHVMRHILATITNIP